MACANDFVITIKLEPSDERLAIARYIEVYSDAHSLTEMIDHIRDGSYISYLPKSEDSL